MNAVRLLLGFLPVGGPLLVPQDLPDVACAGDGERAGGGLSNLVHGLLPGSIVSSESEWTAESSSESSGNDISVASTVVSGRNSRGIRKFPHKRIQLSEQWRETRFSSLFGLNDLN